MDTTLSVINIALLTVRASAIDSVKLFRAVTP